jgi:hypothetical protein
VQGALSWAAAIILATCITCDFVFCLMAEFVSAESLLQYFQKDESIVLQLLHPENQIKRPVIGTG